MGWRLSLAKKNFNIAKGVVKKGASRLNTAGEKASPVVKREAKRAAKTGSSIFDTITKFGGNVNRNIERSYSGGPRFDLIGSGNRKAGGKKRRKHRKGKRRTVTVVID